MKRILLISLAVLFIFAAVLFAAYPAISNYLSDKYQSEVRTDYEAEVREIDDTALRELRTAAETYNAALAPIQFNREGIAAATVDYHDLLNPSGSGIMGYVEIPKIQVNLPIYHGTSETVLEEGVGHLIGSSLPIGGEGTHTVLTGHSGVAGRKLFSDLDQLQVGDVFYIKALGETLAYEVTEINTVLPHETDLLELVSGEDLSTLVTCTPFGINSHRLLVRGTRVSCQVAEELAEMPGTTQPEQVKSTWMEQYVTGLIIGGAIAGTVILKTFAAKYRTKVSKIKRRYEKNGIFTVPYETKSGTKESVFPSEPIRRSKEPLFGQVDLTEIHKKYGKPNGLAHMLKLKICELCHARSDSIEIHQVKRLSDLDAGTKWGAIMLDHRRKTLAVCPDCHRMIHEKTNS